MLWSEAQARRLDETAALLRRSDPQLARALSRGRFRPRGADVVTVVVCVLLFGTLAIGIAFRLSVVCAAAWTAVIPLMVARGMFSDSGY